MSIKSPDDPRVRRTRKLLQKALEDLLAEKELSDISVQDIAERADVNRATFYAHFDDKFALLNYSIKERFAEHLHKRSAEGMTFTTDNMRLLILVTYEFLSAFVGHCAPTVRQGPDVTGLMLIQLQTEVYDRVLAWLTPHGDPKPELTAMVVSWAIFGTMLQWTRIDRHIDADDAADQILTRVMPILEPYFVKAGVS